MSPEGCVSKSNQLPTVYAVYSYYSHDGFSSCVSFTCFIIEVESCRSGIPQGVLYHHEATGESMGWLLQVIPQLLSKLTLETSSKTYMPLIRALPRPAEAFWTDDGGSRVGFLLKFKTSCTNRADVIEAKVKFSQRFTCLLCVHTFSTWISPLD